MSASAPMSASEPWPPGGGGWQGQPPPVTPTQVTGTAIPGVPEYPPVTLAPGEAVMREWLVSRMKRVGWIDSSLTVTDARVIYRARSKSFLGFSSSSREVQLQEVSGAALVTRRGLTPLNLLTVALGFVAAIVAVRILEPFLQFLIYSMGGYSSGYGTVSPWIVLLYVLVVLITIAVLVVRYFSKEIVLVIYARSMDMTPISVAGSQWRQGFGLFASIGVGMFGPLLLFAEWLGLADATAATDQADPAATQRMFNEFGALILDLQSRGGSGGRA